MKHSSRGYRRLKAALFLFVLALCLHALYVPKAHADLATVQEPTAEFVLIAILVLAGEALLVTWLFRRRGFKRLRFWAALLILNLITWSILLGVYPSLTGNVYLVEAGIVILEAAAIFYISRLAFVRPVSSKPVGILGAVCSSALGNLFSWGLGVLLLLVWIHLRGTQGG